MKTNRIKYVKSDKHTFWEVLKDRVNHYFEENSRSRKGQAGIIPKAIFSLSLLLIPYFILISRQPTDGLIFLLFALMGIGVAMVGMNIMHEGCHGAFHSNKWINLLAANTMYLVGGDKTIWLTSHNVLHHSFTNIYGHDVDLEAGNGIIRLTEHAGWQPKHRYQHIYAFFLYSMLTFTWIFLTDFLKMRKFINRKVLAMRDPESPRHWARLIFFKLLSYTFWLFIPLLTIKFPAWKYLLGFFFMHLVSGIILTLVFQLAHLTEKAEMPRPDEKGNIQNSWAIHQLQTTANWGIRNPFWNWFTGGLNHQIEHHLFPGISHLHYPKIAPIIEATAKEFQLDYHVFPGIQHALKGHYSHLKEMGQKPLNEPKQHEGNVLHTD